MTEDITRMISESKTSMSENGAFQGAIDSYLAYNMTNQGALIHWAAILTSEVADTSLSKRTTSDLSTIKSFNVLDRKVLEKMNEFYKETKDPNLEGIPIKSPEISVTRDVDVADYGVIMDESYMHTHVVDNAVPKPRVWNVQGYLESNWGADIGLILKPSLQFQAKMLDGYAQSRRPLWFKTDENEFVRVQISSLSFNRKAEWMNGCQVTLQLKEFVPLELLTSMGKFRKAQFILTH